METRLMRCYSRAHDKKFRSLTKDPFREKCKLKLGPNAGM